MIQYFFQVDQRNLAISWLRKRLKVEPGHAIVYFMDDDNSYDTELFTEISKLKRGKVGVWPVGLVGALNVESNNNLRKGLIFRLNDKF